MRHADKLAASSATVLLAAVCVLAVLLVVSLRQQEASSSPLGVAAAQGAELALTLEVSNAPRTIHSGNGPPQVMFDALIVRATSSGQVHTGTLNVRVVASMAWVGLHPGGRAGTAGRIVPVGAGEKAAGLFRPTTEPLDISRAEGGLQAMAAGIRSSWLTSVQGAWSSSSADVAGLLPGMVMGERGGLDASLEDSMKLVGLTHLTAVSGANCTLVLASLMLILRSWRVPRIMAATGSVTGLGGFVLVVGPDPSVLRAGVMGGIGAMAILGGRPKRIGVLLSLSILVLLIGDPWLAGDYAFILSVLATLGLHLVGQRCVLWLSVLLPVWLAQAVAIPLAAQLFCAPVIVLLQARLTPYTIPANMLAAPVVALITTVGTLGMAVAAVAPQLAGLCAVVSGAGAWWVAAVARFMAGLPAASLPWPEGVTGVLLMALLNAAVLCALVSVVHRARVASAVAQIQEYLPSWWVRRFGFSAVVAAAAGTTLWWTAAVVRL